MMLVAGPVEQELATSLTGPYECDVKNSVTKPMTHPLINPQREQAQALSGLLSTEANPYNLSGRVR